VFTRLSVIDLSLPAPSSNAIEQLTGNDLKLEIVVRADALEVGDRIGGLIARIPSTAAGPDVHALQALVEKIKARFPDKLEASVLAEPNTPYDTLVQVMDAVRSGHRAEGAALVQADLFPNLSIGDAPVRTRVSAR
jgi:hypothetical protein